MLSTAYPQVFHILSIIALCVSIAGIFYCKNKILRDFPGRTTITAMQLEVGELSQATADLNDRFTRFQRREGMRDARSAKEREQDILAQAQQIAAQGASDEPQGDDKRALYRRRTKLQ